MSILDGNGVDYLDKEVDGNTGVAKTNSEDTEEQNIPINIKLIMNDLGL